MLCFEPQEKPFEQLKKWAEKQRNVTAFPYALGDHNGDVTMNAFPGMPRHSTLHTINPNFSHASKFAAMQTMITVPIRRLDDVVADMQLQESILIKIDVEGFELEVIAGAHETLHRTTACIIEAHTDEHFVDQPNLSKIMQALEPLGLEYVGNLMQHADPKFGADYMDALFINHRLLGA